MLNFFKQNIQPLSEELDEIIHKPTTGNQMQRTYKMLSKAGKHGVANHQFSDAGILRYGSTIAKLRKEGYSITVERLVLPNGRSTQTWMYYLGDE